MTWTCGERVLAKVREACCQVKQVSLCAHSVEKGTKECANAITREGNGSVGVYCAVRFQDIINYEKR